MKNTANMSDEIERIAKQYFHVDTMETRRSDSEDFYDVAIWSIKSALTAAYMAGASARPQKAEVNKHGET
jgi:hypothetical protein